MAGTLVIKQPSSLTNIPIEEQPSIFWKFRHIFEADWCVERKIYWFDTHFNRTRLWQVTRLDRLSKKEDILIGIFNGPPDVDVLKLAIASANNEYILTGVRWELYSDFACTEIVTMGRFDIIDLMPTDRNKLEELYRTNIVGIKPSILDWDFDGIFQTHICPQCHKAYSQDLLMFIPRWIKCNNCGFDLNQDKGKAASIAKILLSRLNRSKKFRFPIQDKTGIPVTIQMIDVLATPLISYIISDLLGMLPALHTHGFGTGLELEELITCLEMSIFNKIRIPVIRKGFINFGSTYFDERITYYQSGGQLPRIPMPSHSKIEYRQYLIDDWERMKQDFIDQTELLANLTDWFLGNKNVLSDNPNQYKLLAAALSDYSFNLETIIELLWQEKQEVSHE